MVTCEKKVTLTVASNTDTLKTSVQSFVTAYNALMTAINTQTKVTATGDASTTTAGALTGDASMRQLVSGLRNELLNSSGSNAAIGLAQMGVSTDSKTGLLSLDDKAWNKAVALPNGATNIAKVFTGDAGSYLAHDQNDCALCRHNRDFVPAHYRPEQQADRPDHPASRAGSSHR
jgi:flagellar hook-associated protein 2